MDDAALDSAVLLDGEHAFVCHGLEGAAGENVGFAIDDVLVGGFFAVMLEKDQVDDGSLGALAVEAVVELAAVVVRQVLAVDFDEDAEWGHGGEEVRGRWEEEEIDD